jgi:hypothetical protein
LGQDVGGSNPSPPTIRHRRRLSTIACSPSSRFNGGMPALTHRRDPDARFECWMIFYGDVHVGTIAVRSVAANLISEGIPH